MITKVTKQFDHTPTQCRVLQNARSRYCKDTLTHLSTEVSLTLTNLGVWHWLPIYPLSHTGSRTEELVRKQQKITVFNFFFLLNFPAMYQIDYHVLIPAILRALDDARLLRGRLKMRHVRVPYRGGGCTSSLDHVTASVPTGGT